MVNEIPEVGGIARCEVSEVWVPQVSRGNSGRLGTQQRVLKNALSDIYLQQLQMRSKSMDGVSNRCQAAADHLNLRAVACLQMPQLAVRSRANMVLVMQGPPSHVRASPVLFIDIRLNIKKILTVGKNCSGMSLSMEA